MNQQPPSYAYAQKGGPGGPPPPPPPQMGSDEGAIRSYLTRNGWPSGLQTALISGLAITPARFFICDDSGSMMSSDGHRVVGTNNNSK
jgi:hypothetical protein